MVSRADRSPFAEWLWTVDRYLVAGFVVLMVGGIVLSFAASPAVAERLDIDSYHFIKRQALFLIPALVVMFGVMGGPSRQASGSSEGGHPAPTAAAQSRSIHNWGAPLSRPVQL